MIHHKIGSLFDAPRGSALVHACNAVGVWGGGIAAQFARRFPHAYSDYQKYCRSGLLDMLVGTYRIYRDIDYWIVSLITSKGYGAQKDPQEEILENTGRAVRAFLIDGRFTPGVQLHSPRINAGLFGVPWEKTEAVLEAQLRPFSKDWYVWTPPAP